ncbi:MAG: hypothetical protein PHG02_01295 [Oscillospiraceae bacterium]|nr:hypothetical protein [Oscillospiraceae bacterium]
MTDFTLTQTYSLIALNAQDSLNLTTAKKAALRCAAAAVVLESYLNGTLVAQKGDIFTFDACTKNDFLYAETVLPAVTGLGSQPLSRFLKAAAAISAKRLKALERNIADSLKGVDALTEIPNLMGCDYFYCSAQVNIREYRTQETTYLAITEALRADILEDVIPTDETLCLLWLLKESGSLADVFSQTELDLVMQKIGTLLHTAPFVKTLFGTQLHHGLQLTVKAFLKSKKAFVKTPLGTGINYALPILERSQSVFIDTEAYFSNGEKRLNDVLERLALQGHSCSVLRTGEVPLLKIDNIVYEAIPDYVGGKMPVHGVRLRKYPL